jgi:hypothetical protein
MNQLRRSHELRTTIRRVMAPASFAPDVGLRN